MMIKFMCRRVSSLFNNYNIFARSRQLSRHDTSGSAASNHQDFASQHGTTFRFLDHEGG